MTSVAALAAQGDTTRVSVDSAGVQSDDDSYYPSISSDGRYVAFQSYASNLVAGDTNGTWDIFVHQLGGGGGSSGPCFIATAVDENYFDAQVRKLRKFIDGLFSSE